MPMEYSKCVLNYYNNWLDTWSIASGDLYEEETFVYINSGRGGDLFFAGITSLQTLVKAKF